MILFTFAGHELSKNLNIQKKLQQEVDDFGINQGTKNITFSDLKELKFMTRYIMETLRLWSAVANGTFRELEEDGEIMGLHGKKVKIKKGSHVQIMNWTRYRNP
jgi:cytochrome P450